MKVLAKMRKWTLGYQNNNQWFYNFLFLLIFLLLLNGMVSSTSSTNSTSTFDDTLFSVTSLIESKTSTDNITLSDKLKLYYSMNSSIERRLLSSDIGTLYTNNYSTFGEQYGGLFQVYGIVYDKSTNNLWLCGDNYNDNMYHIYIIDGDDGNLLYDYSGGGESSNNDYTTTPSDIIIIDHDFYPIIIGNIIIDGSDSSDIFVDKLNKDNGDIIWRFKTGSLLHDEKGISVDYDGTYIIAFGSTMGSLYSNNPYQLSDIFFIVLNSTNGIFMNGFQIGNMSFNEILYDGIVMGLYT